MQARAGSDMRHAIARVQTIGGHAVATGGVRVHVCGGVDYAAASLAARKLAPTSVCEHVNAWLTCGMGGARYLSMRKSTLAPAAADERPSSVQHLRCSAAPVGSTDSTSHCCPPRLRRSCAAAEALATASTWAAR